MSARTSNDGRMTLVEHLTELRKRLIRCILAIAAGGVVCWVFYPQILRALIRPYCGSLTAQAKADTAALLGQDCKLLQTDPLEGFSIRLTIAGYGGIALAMPFVLWQMWRFVAPGLYRHERRYALPFVVTGLALFLLGGGLAYWSVPRALSFLNGVGGKDLVTVFAPKPYLGFITKMIVAFGIGFEFPIVLCFLQMVGLVSPGTLRRVWRYAAVGIVALVAVITPSGDPITLVVLSVPMYLFYELSILYGRLWARRRRKKEAAAGAVA
jgi:sec-independent protein translocase protein TatC